MNCSNDEAHVRKAVHGFRKPKISHPLFATAQHSTVSSKMSPASSQPTSLKSSPTSTPPVAPLNSARLRHIATTLLTALANTHDYALAAPMIAANAQFQHEDNVPKTSREVFLDAWKGMVTRSPGFNIEILEAVADERDRKVWIQGLMSVCGTRKDCTIMMVFDEEGMCVRSWDQAKERRPDGDRD